MDFCCLMTQSAALCYNVCKCWLSNRGWSQDRLLLLHNTELHFYNVRKCWLPTMVEAKINWSCLITQTCIIETSAYVGFPTIVGVRIDYCSLMGQGTFKTSPHVPCQRRAHMAHYTEINLPELNHYVMSSWTAEAVEKLLLARGDHKAYSSNITYWFQPFLMSSVPVADQWTVFLHGGPHCSHQCSHRLSSSHVRNKCCWRLCSSDSGKLQQPIARPAI